MKNIVISLAAAAALFSGCETKTGTGALVGGVVGTGVGAAISGGTGAVIGAGGGALIGGLIGSSLDQNERHIMERHAPRTLKKLDSREELTIYDIKVMSNAGVDDKVIISEIGETGSRFNLTSADIVDLKNAGVSQNVIDVMLGY